MAKMRLASGETSASSAVAEIARPLRQHDAAGNELQRRRIGRLFGLDEHCRDPFRAGKRRERRLEWF